MASPTFSLATILAIVIPLGVVCLTTVLILGLVFFRYVTVASREKRAYEVYRKRGSNHGSTATRGSDIKYHRSCLDIICCIPPSVYASRRSSNRQSEAYTPKLETPEQGFGIAESQRKLSDASRTQSLKAQQLQKMRATREHNDKDRATAHQSHSHTPPSVNGNDALNSKLNPRPLKKNDYMRTEALLPEDIRVNDSGQFDPHFPIYGNEVGGPESVLSTPKTMSIQDSIYTPKPYIEGAEGKFPHPYAQGTRQPPVDSRPSSASTSQRHFEVSNNSGSFTPLPAPPGIKAPLPYTPSPIRNNVRNEYVTKDPGIHTSPSFASKLRSLTPNTQQQPQPLTEPVYPAKSELRSKQSWKKFDVPTDDNASHYYSATNSFKSNALETDSPFSARVLSFSTAPQMQFSPVKPLAQNGRPSPSRVPSEKQLNSTPSKGSQFPTIDEVPYQLNTPKTEDSFAEFFKTPENNLTMTPPPPPASRQSKYSPSSNDVSPAKIETVQHLDLRKEAINDPASLSSGSVVDPNKILKVLQKNEQIVESREHIGITQVTRGHSVAPSYSGSFIQPLNSNNGNNLNNNGNTPRHTNDFLKTYQLPEIGDSNHHSYSSGSKQSTPVDKMSNYTPTYGGNGNVSHSLFNGESPLQPAGASTPQTRNDTLRQLQPSPIPEHSVHYPTETTTPPPHNHVEGLKGFSKSSAQLSSPLGSPHSSFVPSRHSSLSNQSFHRSKSFLGGHSFSYLRRKSVVDGVDMGREVDLNSEENKDVSTITSGDGNASSKHTITGVDLARTQSKTVKGLSIAAPNTPVGTISAIAALNPPASPRSPGYEPSKGALITSPKSKSNKSLQTVNRQSNIPAVKKNNKRLDGAKKRLQFKSLINKPLPSTPIILEDGVVSHLHGAKFMVVSPYKSRLSDEIDLEVGDIVKVNEVFDDNWCRARIVQSSLPTINRNLRGVCPKACLSVKPI